MQLFLIVIISKPQLKRYADRSTHYQYVSFVMFYRFQAIGRKR